MLTMVNNNNNYFLKRGAYQRQAILITVITPLLHTDPLKHESSTWSVSLGCIKIMGEGQGKACSRG